MFSVPVLSRTGTFLKRSAQQQQQNVRGMATLKAISVRLKSVKNIQKITQSMKMVSAAKYARAERELKAARPLGVGSTKFYESAEVGAGLEDNKDVQKLYVAVTSDRGLCGAVHTTVARSIRNDLVEQGDKIKVICIGDKARALLQRLYGKNILFVVNEIGKLPPTFRDASRIANEIINSGYSFDLGKIIYNKFKTVVSYITTDMPMYKLETVTAAPKIALYDSVDEEVLKSYMEFSLATMIFYALKESSCSEQSSRMTAMDNASKNAGEMIDKLTLTFNRTRQAVITRELIEIISGASAL